MGYIAIQPYLQVNYLPPFWPASLVGALVALICVYFYRLLGRRESLLSAVPRVDTEQALSLNKGRFHNLIHNVPDAIIIYDPKSDRILESNPAAEKILHCPGSELAGATLARFYHFEQPDGRNAVQCVVEDCRQVLDGYQLRVERVIRAGDELKTCELRMAVIRWGGSDHIRISISDITEQKKSEAVKNLLIRAVEQASDAVVITDASGGILYVNPAFERLSGYEAKELIGKNPRILKSGKHPQEFYSRMWSTLLAGSTWTGSMSNQRRDGSIYRQESTISPMRDATGRIVNFVGVHKDVTLQELLKEQLFHVQRMESIGRLAGGIAHDFNNLLMAIQSCAELLLFEEALSGEASRHVARILDSTEHGADLTRQLLAFGQRQITTPTVLDLNRTLQESANMLRRVISENVSIRFEPGENLWDVECDPNQLSQICLNLLSNAKNVMPSGGVVTIATQNRIVSHGNVVDRQPPEAGEYVTISVSDTSDGIDPDLLENLFDPFFVSRERGQGAGIGLATVFGIVKQNNGHIFVDSQLGKGTRFTIWFPRSTKSRVSEGRQDGESPGRNSRCTILLVEDEEQLRTPLAEYLRQSGYQVFAAASGEEALVVAAQHRNTIDLLVTDLVMPGLGGRELSTRLEQFNPRLKTIYMSGHTDDEVARQDIRQRELAFLQKPFRLAALASMIEKTILSFS